MPIILNPPYFSFFERSLWIKIDKEYNIGISFLKNLIQVYFCLDAVKRIKSSLNIKFIYINAPLRNKKKVNQVYRIYYVHVSKLNIFIFFFLHQFIYILANKKGKLINNLIELKKKTTTYSSLIWYGPGVSNMSALPIFSTFVIKIYFRFVVTFLDCIGSYT